MEVYVDDMIVKSKNTESHAPKLTEVFKVLKKYNMRFNPNKCSFRVQSKKFLGCMITQREIKDNPKKYKLYLTLNPQLQLKKSNN